MNHQQVASMADARTRGHEWQWPTCRGVRLRATDVHPHVAIEPMGIMRRNRWQERPHARCRRAQGIQRFRKSLEGDLRQLFAHA
jgi:hypothetical protein